MNPGPQAQRFYDAACTAAAREWNNKSAPELLLRIGLPGLTHGGCDSSPATIDEGFQLLQKLHHTLLFESATAISEELTDAGIQHFFAKGIALLHRFYEPGDRSMSDIDLYIREGSKDDVLALLNGMGFIELPDREQAGPPEMRTALALRREDPAALEQHIVDLHWCLDPVDRLLPRPDTAIPELVWNNILTDRRVATPAPEYHAALLAHHVVHTDLLHARNLLDMVFEFDAMPEHCGVDYLTICHSMGMGEFAAFLARLIASEFGIVRPNAMGTDSSRLVRFERDLTLDSWLALIARSHPHEDEAITMSRLRRRLRVLDAGGARTLLEDVFFPPTPFLRWRWKGHALGLAWLRHYGQLLNKALRR